MDITCLVFYLKSLKIWVNLFLSDQHILRWLFLILVASYYIFILVSYVEISNMQAALTYAAAKMNMVSGFITMYYNDKKRRKSIEKMNSYK